MRIRIGTRSSQLALIQTRWVADRLREAHSDVDIEEVELRTHGDRDQETPLDAQGGVGLFTKELERALLASECDLAVHSLKDLPTTLPEGLVLGAVPARELPWDVWISERYASLVDLPEGAVVATGSLRRRSQILYGHPRLKVTGIRGNIDTRLARYQEQGAAGLILAAAGLRRIGRGDAIRATFGPTEMTPAPGQGALGLEVRSDDQALIECVAALEDPATRAAVSAERAFMAAVEAGCHSPVGAIGRAIGDGMTLMGMLAGLRGERLLRLSVEGPTNDPRGVGEKLAEKMRRAGGDEILAAMREEQSS